MGTMNGQVALVTGGIRGIGRAIGERLAARGCTIAAGYTRGKEAAGEFRAPLEIAARGGQRVSVRVERNVHSAAVADRR